MTDEGKIIIGIVIAFVCAGIVLYFEFFRRKINHITGNIPPKRNPPPYAASQLGVWKGRHTFDSGYTTCGCFPMCRIDCPDRATCIIESGPLHYARLPSQRASLMPLFNEAKLQREERAEEKLSRDLARMLKEHIDENPRDHRAKAQFINLHNASDGWGSYHARKRI